MLAVLMTFADLCSTDVNLQSKIKTQCILKPLCCGCMGKVMHPDRCMAEGDLGCDQEETCFQEVMWNA